MSYSKRYFYLLGTGNIGKNNSFSSNLKTDVIKCLIIVTKYMGLHEQFKAALKSCGIKVSRPDAFAAFVRLYNNHNSNLDEWFAMVKPVLTSQENLLLRFLQLTGLRANEGIAALV